MSVSVIAIRAIPAEAGILAQGHAIYRDLKLSAKSGGKALLKELRVAYNK